jgi:hypothetical protein
MTILPDSYNSDNADKTNKSGFFAVDRRSWEMVCTLGMNPAVAYLILASGTGGDNKTTSWSVHAVETHTGISRCRAKASIKTLRDAGITNQTRGGSRPRYELPPWSKITGQVIERKPLTIRQQEVFDVVLGGNQPTIKQKQIAYALARKGWLDRHSDGTFVKAKEYPADWIWLPNEIVTGAVDETPPLELLRQTQDVMALRLFIDLYHGQNLREDGGISRQHVYELFDRHLVGQQGQFTVWGFTKPNTQTVAWSNLTEPHYRDKKDLTKEEIKVGKNPGIDFFRRMDHLTRLGLVEWMPHLLESDEPDAEIIHPMGRGDGGGIEDRIGDAAHRAGVKMLTPRQAEWADSEGLHTVPVPHHIDKVQMFSVARLRYRPKTKLTAAWWAEMQAKGEQYIRHYEDIAGVSSKDLQHQGDIKVRSR